MLASDTASCAVQAEVQALHADGSIALHTRSAKYGKVAFFASVSRQADVHATLLRHNTPLEALQGVH